MPARVYQGPFVDGVELVMPDGSTVHVDQGGTVEVPGDVAKRLDEQPDNWAKAPSKKGD